jgi:hypothetical protein
MQDTNRAAKTMTDFVPDESFLDQDVTINPLSNQTTDDFTVDSPQKISIRREIELRKAKEREDQEANFTFKPHINEKSPRRDPPGTPRENRFDKLYSDALKRHITTHLREEQKEPELTFTPTIHSRTGSRTHSRTGSTQRMRESVQDHQTSSSSYGVASTPDARDRPRDTRPLGDRLSTPTRRKETPTAAQAEMTFTPSISKRARAIETLGSQEVAKRLYEHGKTAQEKMELRRSEVEQKEKDNCPFTPQLATRSSRPSSAQRARTAPTAKSIASTAERLNRYEEERQLKLEEARKQKEDEEMSQVTFQPQLVTTTRRSMTPTMRAPVHSRLAVPLDKSVSPQVALAYADYTFHPKLFTHRPPSVSCLYCCYCLFSWLY